MGAAGRATAISAPSRRAAPTIGTTSCTSATSSATINAKWPISGIMSRWGPQMGSEQDRDFGVGAISHFALTPFYGCSLLGLVHARHRHRALLVRLVDRFLRLGGHVVLVVFREHLGRMEGAVGPELALRDDAFPLLEEIGQQPRICDGNRLRRIRHAEMHG